MSCTSPRTAYMKSDKKPTDNVTLAWSEQEAAARWGGNYHSVQIPCGNCLACRLKKSQEWATRCQHELRYHKEACFLTLTYNNENLPTDGCVSNRAHQLFMKRLRKYIDKVRPGCKIRFFMCGEYGSKKARPHYHYIIFGFDFDDKVVHARTSRGDLLFRSPALGRLWPFGFSTIGSVTHESCAYVARYVTKKMHGKDGASFYKKSGLTPEFCRCSNRPGIGFQWFEEFADDCCRTGQVPLLKKGQIHHIGIPRYYLKILRRVAPNAYDEVVVNRQQAALLQSAHDELEAERAGIPIRQWLKDRLDAKLENGRATWVKNKYRSFEDAPLLDNEKYIDYSMSDVDKLNAYHKGFTEMQLNGYS